MDGGGDGSMAPKLLADEMDKTDVQRMDEKTQAVADQTMDVVSGFMHEYHQIRRTAATSPQPRFRHAGIQTDALPIEQNILQPPEELERYLPPAHNEANAELVHRLRRIADDMEESYRPTVISLVNRWLLDLHRDGRGPLELRQVWLAFRRVMQSVLGDGITWSKILLLLMFAYEIAVALYVEGVPQLIREIITQFAQFLIESPVVRWIASNGGWAAGATALWINSVGIQLQAAAPYVCWIFGIGALALGAFLFMKSK